MVKNALMCLLLLCMSVSGFAVDVADVDPKVRVVVNAPQVEMGKYLSVRIEYIGDSVPETSNLQQWYEDFFVDRRAQEAEKLPNGWFKYTEYLRLYPRKMGNRVLHAIALGGAIAQPVKISVMPAVRDGIDGTPHWQSLPDRIWQGQTITVSIIQNLLHPANQIVMEDGKFPGFYVEQLDHKTVQQGTNKIVQLHWLFTAQTSGLVQLEAPAIEQRGRGRWRFYLPRTKIKVKPLPSYMPPTVPVGKLSIRTGVIELDKKTFWIVEIQNMGQLPDEIYGIRTQLSELTGSPKESVKVSVNRADSHSSMNFVHRYSIPVADWRLGFTDGPEIFVQYFDVDEGRIKIVTDRLPGIWSVPRVWHKALLFMPGLILISALVASIKGIKNILAWRRYQLLLKQTNNPHELRRLLLAQGNYCSLDTWSSVKDSHIAKQIVRQLNTLCFARSCHFSLDEIKYQVVNFHTYRRWSKFVLS